MVHIIDVCRTCQGANMKVCLRRNVSIFVACITLLAGCASMPRIEYERHACINNMEDMVHVGMCCLGMARQKGEDLGTFTDYSVAMQDVWRYCRRTYHCPSSGRYSVLSLTNMPACSVHGGYRDDFVGSLEHEEWLRKFDKYKERKKYSESMPISGSP